MGEGEEQKIDASSLNDVSESAMEKKVRIKCYAPYIVCDMTMLAADLRHFDPVFLGQYVFHSLVITPQPLGV